MKHNMLSFFLFSFVDKESSLKLCRIFQIKIFLISCNIQKMKKLETSAETLYQLCSYILEMKFFQIYFRFFTL